MISGHFLSQNCVQSSHVKESVMKGHPSSTDIFFVILRCPLKTGFTECILVIIGFTLNSTSTFPVICRILIGSSC